MSTVPVLLAAQDQAVSMQIGEGQASNRDRILIRVRTILTISIRTTLPSDEAMLQLLKRRIDGAVLAPEMCAGCA